MKNYEEIKKYYKKLRSEFDAEKASLYLEHSHVTGKWYFDTDESLEVIGALYFKASAKEMWDFTKLLNDSDISLEQFKDIIEVCNHENK